MSSNKFDWEYYINKYEDLKILGINNKQKAINHYKEYGKKENKFPNKISEIKNNKIESYNNKTQNNKFLENISFEMDMDDPGNYSTYNSLSENDKTIENNILHIKKDIDNIKNDIHYIKYNMNILIKILSKDKVSSQPNNIKLNNKKPILNNNNSLDETSKIQSSEEYEVCDNLSDSSNDDIIVDYSNTNNSDDISYDKD
jgi:hypothetical protein